ncbi:uncharacterized protein LOC116801490 isoform X3 [Drosophila sechellia]|uniref:uncharacterized protein LOC116801490 isoform X3 n=1 Tax=Drosophila sechellia TaxID=7238 RepID=UPI0013DD9C24|nr:uncharacterized protein LOC116801490 isoform X3 [Drosophila sechellia]
MEYAPSLITHRPLQGPWSEDLTRRQLHQFQFFDGLVDGYSGHSSASSRVCVCVFMTFVDYAYKNYTSPRSQRSGHQLQQRIDNNYSAKMIQPVAREITNGAVFMVCSAFV